VTENAYFHWQTVLLKYHAKCLHTNSYTIRNSLTVHFCGDWINLQ